MTGLIRPRVIRGPGNGRAALYRAVLRHSLAAIVLLPFLPGCGPDLNGTLQVTGQIEGVTVAAGSKVGGRIAEVTVKEGDSVKAGDVLIRLDDAEAKAVLAAAEAKLAAMEAQLAKVETGATPEQLRQAEAFARAAEEKYRMAEKGARTEEIRMARAGLDSATAQLDEARKEFARAEKLRSEGVAAQRQFDQAKAARDAAEAQFHAAREKHEMVVRGLRDEEIAAAKALYDQAQAALDEVRRGAREEDRAAARAARDAAAADRDRAEVALREMTVVSPLDGVIESLDVHPGDLVKPGPVVRIANPEDLEMYVYVSAVMLGRIHLDEKIPLTTDAHGDERFEARVVQIATQGEYTPRNLQTQEERVQQVFGIKLKLDSAGGKLRAGMTAIAHIAESPAATK